jgi:uncharacterized membrane protein YjgN (DUF898 family)
MPDDSVAEPATPAAGGSTPTPHTLPVRFVGSGSEYFRIWIVNLLLTLVTIGLYYPFAKVRRLRYFHGATEVGGAPLSFHADPWKMFRGYVLVLLMLAAYSGAGQFSATAGLIAFVIVAALWPALWHSSMRFRLANTGWRGLRLAYTGRAGQAYGVMALPLVAVLVFLVWALLLQPDAPNPTDAAPAQHGPSGFELFVTLLPALVMAALAPLFLWLLKRLQHSNYALGPEKSAFSAGLGSFYGLALKTLGVGLLAIAVVVAVVLGVGVLMGVLQEGGKAMAVVLTVVSVMLSYLFVFALAGGFWTARLQNLCWGRTASRHLRFVSTLRARSLAGLWFKNTLLVIVTLGLYFPFAQVASARMRLQAMSVVSTLDPDELVARAGSGDEAAAGDAAGDLLGFDIGL